MLEQYAAPELRFEHGNYWSACSSRGAQRTRNSDALAVVDSGTCLAFVVADGVGAMEASPLASTVAASAAADWARSRREVVLDDVPSLLTSVNDAVANALRERGEAGATTLACAIIADGSAIVATIGDSEVLAIGPAGAARRLNELDHVPGRPNVLLAWIDGEAEFELHVVALDALPYRMCLVTDGIVKVLDYRRIATIVRRTPPSTAARALVLAAQDLGATDDVTALVLSADLVADVRLIAAV